MSHRRHLHGNTRDVPRSFRLVYDLYTIRWGYFSVVDCCVVVRCLQWPLDDTIAGKDGSGWLNPSPRSSGARQSRRSMQKRAEAALSLIGTEQARVSGCCWLGQAAAVPAANGVTSRGEDRLFFRRWP
jgi:hypothetical protein